jgi:hypothetical protein
LSLYEWALTDTCGYQDSGLSANEVIGSITDDYFLATGTHNNWGTPATDSWYDASYVITDEIYAANVTVPASEPPQTPTLTNVKVLDDNPYNINVGTQTPGSGTTIRYDVQQWYQDHGRHN